ncbi:MULTISPECIES: hypothetical protein [unclassified Fibrobacter]|uniref:hypothetical protein n=1 Tax=unclassified Fibrobacter TaxID=2634177 RepID=UPI000D7B2551|nr:MULTISPECIES: hypothetical protein [unclassified Fibrobacter]PWJ69000.1 hypothetical protein BGX12_10655 [Fibrobacter sp. UWR4]PZW70846.1 hypothetical protein C8E88_101038 [Fibrobacter sp. UWR1]
MKMNKSASKMITRTLGAIALTSGVAAASVASNQQLLESKVDSANAHRGLEVTGAIRGIAQASYVNTDQDPYGKATMPDVERNEFVNADFNFGFRPWESVRANAMLRLYAGMQDYFAAAAKIIEVPWLNVEGQIGNSFYWTVGDFRQQYSPLTLFNPDVDVLYEPTIFARQRHMAEKQQLLEGNQRNLQGANLQFRHGLNDVLGEIRVEGMFARVNRAQPLDFSGAEGNILPNETIAGATQASNTDKFVLAGNLELFPLKRNAYVAATAMYIFDNEDSKTVTYRHPDNDPNASLEDEEGNVIVETGYYRQEAINPFDLSTQKTLILGGRFGGDVAGMMGNSKLILDATAELALSSNDAYVIVPMVNEDGDIDSYVAINDPENEGVSGVGFNANLNVGYTGDSWKLKVSADLVFNDSAWFNNLAQSPKFFAQRVLNSDYDGNTVKFGINSPLYTTFDALYNFAPKFSPVTASMKTDDNGFKKHLDSYDFAPYSKNSYSSTVYSQAQLELLAAMADPAIQMVLPNGLATANRQGLRANVTFDLSDWLEVQGLFGMFSQTSPLAGLSAVDYTDFGGGLKVDVFKALGFSKPLEISGSYRHTERSMDASDGSGTAEMKTDFINAGLYVQYLPRLGFTAGFQMVNMEMNDMQQLYSAAQFANIATTAPMVTGKQMQWMVGLDYSLDKNVWLSLNFGMVSVENTYNTTISSMLGGNAVNLPVYADASLAEFTSEFTQTVVEASINVEF